MYRRPAAICPTALEVLVAPTAAQVESRNCAIPYALEVGFCAVGFQPDSCCHNWYSAFHCCPVQPTPAAIRCPSATAPPTCPGLVSSPPMVPATLLTKI